METRLEKIGTNGKTLYWDSKVEGKTLIITFGARGESERIQHIDYPSPELAVKREAERRAKKINREGYLPANEISDRIFPMLAVNLKDIGYEALPSIVAVQPKIDGIRCISSSLWLKSRTWQDIRSAPHIKPALNLPPGIVVDGELHVDGLEFNKQLEFINRQTPSKDCCRIKYRIFDIVSHHPFLLRSNVLADLYHSYCNKKFIELVPTHTCRKNEVQEWHEGFLKDGYEGTIIRDPKSPYMQNARPNCLVKLKEEYDDIFEILDIVGGKPGREENCAMFCCKTKEGKPFKARPKMDFARRQHILANKEKYIGYLTEVRYTGLHPSGIPREPRAYGLRLKS